MANSYLMTLFVFLLLQMSFISTKCLHSFNTTSSFYVYFSVVAVFTLLLLIGFTNAVKANRMAKGYSYFCAVVCSLSALVITGLLSIRQQFDMMTMVIAVITLLFSMRLAFVTYKKTKSYF